ncbi:MAG: hypothetical protein U0350_11280 [Caldilineaceae bacterium]
MANLWSRGRLYCLIATCLLFVGHELATSVQAARPASINEPVTEIVYRQPASDTPLQHQSSQVGYAVYASDYDQYVWDSFTLHSTRAISEITWRGFYKTGGYWGGAVVDFTVAIYPSAVANTEPDHLHPPLVQYTVGSNAGETPVWTAGPPVLTLHDYRFTLPTPFTATAGVKYWVQIEGIQNGPADWGVVAGTGGDNAHFFALPGAGDFRFGIAPGDAAFTLLGPSGEVQPTPLTSVTISGPTIGVINTNYTFTATTSPITATLPITYTWSPPPKVGQGTATAAYTWPVTGSELITVTAANSGGAVSARHTITLVDQAEVCLPLILQQ